MYRIGRLKLVPAIGALVLLAAPAAADPFCDALAKIGPTAANNFAGIRGKPDDPGGQQYSRALVLPGSLMKPANARCSVFANAEGNHYFYSCNFNMTGDAESSVAIFSTRVAACLGQPAPPINHASLTPVPSDPFTEQTVANVSYRVEFTEFHDYDPIPGWKGISLTVSTPSQ